MAKTQERRPRAHQDPDLLAAVVLHTLVTHGREGMTPASLALACERNPDRRVDMEEIEAAVTLLREDGLAELVAPPDHEHHSEGEDHEEHLVGPTRPAIRASELSF